MIKVLCIITTRFVLGGGLTNSYLNYYHQINRTDIHIDFASSNNISYELSKLLSIKESIYFQLPERRKIFLYVKELTKLLKSGQYDCVHINGNSATLSLEIFSARRAKIKNIITHIHNVKTKHKLINGLLKHYFNKWSTYKLACSYDAGAWIYDKPFTVIKNCVPFDKYKFSESKRKKIRSNYNINDDELLLGTVGRCNEQKNQMYLLVNLENYLKNNNVKLMIVGSGNLEEKLKKYVCDHNIENKVIFTGFKSNIDEFMCAFDMFLFPSKYEGYGMAVLEAQISGLDCLVSDNVPKEVSVCSNCYFFNLNSNSEFFNKFIEINKIGVDREQKSDYAIKSAKENRFDIKDNVNILLDIYRSGD